MRSVFFSTPRYRVCSYSASNQPILSPQDSVSGIKAGVAAGMPVIGISTRNPEDLLMGAKPAFLIKDYDDPKLWAALEELDKSGSH